MLRTFLALFSGAFLGGFVLAAMFPPGQTPLWMAAALSAMSAVVAIQALLQEDDD